MILRKIDLTNIHLWLPLLLAAILIAGILFFTFYPENIPEDEVQRISQESEPFDVVIILNPGGWGNATLEQATDFTPLLQNIQEVLRNLGYSSTIIAYHRTTEDISGTITGIKELMNSYKNSSDVQASDIEKLRAAFPDKQFILTGFSNGGAMTDRTMENLANHQRVVSIIAGVPGWYSTHSGPDALVLNNSGKDSLSSFDIKTIFINVIKAPFRWIWAKVTGRDLSLARSFQFPGHEYLWSSPEVGPPITQFLEAHFKPETVISQFPASDAIEK